MRIRFYNCRILTMQEPLQVMEGELQVEDGRIRYVGEQQSDGSEVWDREIDGKGCLLMPGFKNAHTHSGMTVLRSFADDLPLKQWLYDLVFKVEAELTSEDIYHLTRLAVLEYLTSGVTAVFDMYLTPESIHEAFVSCGMRNVQVSGLNDFSQSVEMMEEMYEKLNHADDLSGYRLGFHAEYTCSLELLKRISETAARYQAPVFMHNSETREEVEACIQKYGKTPTALFDELGIFDYGGGGYHCVHFTEEDIEIFRRRKLSVVTNPASNLKLASGIAPISRFLEAGVNVAIGTDGPASNNCLDMFREMFLVTGLAKYRDQNAASVDAADVLRMATVGGAKAMGLTGCETLSEGSLADLIMLDLNQPNMQPLNNIVKNIVYSGSKQNVKMTMINGKILYEDGKFSVGEDVSVIYQEADRIVKRMQKRFQI